MIFALYDLWFLDLIFYENDNGGEGKLHLISDKPYAFILQHLGGKWLL